MIRFSNNAQNVVQYASQCAADTGGMVCSEHLLYALLSVEGTVAYRILTAHGLNRGSVAPALRPAPHVAQVKMSGRSATAMQYAREVAEKLRSNIVGTEHILYALLDDSTSMAFGIVSDLGADPVHIQRDNRRRGQKSRDVRRKLQYRYAKCGNLRRADVL